jgi:hypothetical protein
MHRMYPANHQRNIDSPPEAARDHLSTLDYDFLNLKFPPNTENSSIREGEIQLPPPQYHQNTFSSLTITNALISSTIDLDGFSAPILHSSSPMMSPSSTPPQKYTPSSSSIYVCSFNAPYAGPSVQQLSANDAHILSIQEAARAAVDEDKRRRNTAASARFRAKKKLRDQEIEKAAKEMAERVKNLEKKASTLELENRWLRNLLVEKHSALVNAENGVKAERRT